MAKADERADVLAAVRVAHPERFGTNDVPKVIDLPEAAWINQSAVNNDEDNKPVYEPAA